MKGFARIPLRQAALLVCIAAFSISYVSADLIYKCVENGMINFTTMPSGDRGKCQPFELKVIQPNPAEVARQLEQKRLSAIQERAEAARKRAERKDKELEERLRQAGSAGEAVGLLRQSPYSNSGNRRSWSGRYPHNGPNPPERIVVPPPAQASRPSAAPPTGAGHNP